MSFHVKGSIRYIKSHACVNLLNAGFRIFVFYKLSIVKMN